MKVNFYATLRAIVGKKTVEFDLPVESSVNQLVQEIVRVYPDLRREILDGDGQLLHYIHIFINGRDAHYMADELETRIQEIDRVDIFPPVGGG